jgi:3-oxoacyl-[acyl-carrier-protein] synthase II
MNRRRVVVTGFGAISPFGLGVDVLWQRTAGGECALEPWPEGPAGGPAAVGLAPGFDLKSIPRSRRRSMSKMAGFAQAAAVEALDRAGLAEGPPEDMGLSLGVTMGSPLTMVEFFTEYLRDQGLDRVRGGTFFKIMGHGAAAGLAQALGLSGRLLSPSAACAAGLQAIGLGYEAIAAGKTEAMLCGGTEEFDRLTALTFDHILAASHNPDPLAASRPFDRDRDGLVCGEGAGLIVLESLDRARTRGAEIRGEIAGFATTTSPADLAHPDAEAIARTMTAALADSGLAPSGIQYVNAHATSTVEGDRAEAEAIFRVFGDGPSVNSFKGQLGHTMAASGALEAILSLKEMEAGLILPNHNLSAPEPGFPALRLPREKENRIITAMVKNSFALGGLNACLVLKKFTGE